MLPGMGLRELKAARTRQLVLDVALDLFLDQGYDETTMEQIAAKAEIGTTTLYRYFPSKDVLALEPFRRIMDLGPLLGARPADEPLNVALGAALQQLAQPGSEKADERHAALRKIVDTAPVPRARLWDLYAQAQRGLEDAIAERLQRPVDDLLVVMTSHITFAVLQIATGRRPASTAGVVDEVLRALAKLDLVIPALPRRRA
jgi:AcrR family transcriptional regulator